MDHFGTAKAFLDGVEFYSCHISNRKDRRYICRSEILYSIR
jgi:hypothetical protein